MQDIKISAEDFRNALIEYENNDLQKYESVPEHQFSDKFEHSMQKLIHKRRSSYYPFIRSKKRIAVLVFVLVFLFSITTVLAVDSLKERFFGFIQDIFTDRSQITIEEQVEAPGVIRDKYNLTYVPESYSFAYEESFDVFFARYYKSSETSDEIVFRQTVIKEYNSTIDTEGIKTEKFDLGNGMVGFYWSNKGIQNITVRNSDYIFDISGQISKDEIIKIAESIKK